MAASAIEVCGGDYEHVLGFAADNNTHDAPALRYRVTGLGDLSRLVLGGEGFDAAEYSLANAIMLHDRGDRRLTVLPVFPSRAFRNASIFVRADSPLHETGALAGKRVGISEFAMTTAVWTRGHLHDDTGIDWRGVEWVTGGKPRFAPPAGFRTTTSPDDLETQLLDGRIDALMAGKPRDLQLPPRQRQLRYLLDDTEGIERRYHAGTGLFPIMHTVVLHARAADAARAVFDAYVRTKKAALKRRLSTSLLPFSDRAWDQFNPPGADDPYRHGLTDLNRRNVATLARYLHEQGLIGAMPDIDALFVAGSGEWVDA